MTKRKELGKIKDIYIGYGGYQEGLFGLIIELKSTSGNVCDFKGTWSLDIDCSGKCKWTEEDRSEQFADVMRFTNKIMMQAKKTKLEHMKGVPIEATFDGMKLQDWRILTEVI